MIDPNSDDLSFFAPATHDDLMVNMPALNRRQDLWVKVFDGDLVSAARIAGYQGTPDQLRNASLRLLQNPNVKEALKNRGAYEARIQKAIASREERMLFYSSLMRNSDPYGKLDEDGKDTSEKEIPLAQRIKAAENLSKAHGDFIETINVNHTLSLSDQILKSFQDDTPIEVIEAEYKRVKEQQQITQESVLGDLI